LGATDGGPLAITFAARHPERVAGLILAGTSPKLINSEDFTLGINPVAMESFLRTDASDRGRAVSDLIRTRSISEQSQGNVDVLRRVPQHAWSKITGALGAADARSFLLQVRAPTMIVHDPNNNYIPTEAAYYLHSHIQGSQLEITEDYGTWLFGEILYRKIETFVAEVSPRSPPQA